LLGEREVARIWQAAGFDVRNLEASGDHLVVCANGVTIHSETKRAERLKLPEWLRQAADEAPQGTVPVVAFRQNRGEWYAALPLESLAELIQARPSYNHLYDAVTAQLEHEFDVLGYEGNAEGRDSLERIKAALRGE
jgi:hypothetical protein